MPKPTLHILDRELIRICDSGLDIASDQLEEGWSALQVAGPLDFSLTGILAGIADVLAQAAFTYLKDCLVVTFPPMTC